MVENLGKHILKTEKGESEEERLRKENERLKAELYAIKYDI